MCLWNPTSQIKVSGPNLSSPTPGVLNLGIGEVTMFFIHQSINHHMSGYTTS